MVISGWIAYTLFCGCMQTGCRMASCEELCGPKNSIPLCFCLWQLWNETCSLLNWGYKRVADICIWWRWRGCSTTCFLKEGGGHFLYEACQGVLPLQIPLRISIKKANAVSRMQWTNCGIASLRLHSVSHSYESGVNLNWTELEDMLGMFGSQSDLLSRKVVWTNFFLSFLLLALAEPFWLEIFSLQWPYVTDVSLQKQATSFRVT